MVIYRAPSHDRPDGVAEGETGSCAPSQDGLQRKSSFLPDIDYMDCHRRGILVLSTSSVFAKPVAEITLGMALALARRIHEAEVAIRVGRETLHGEGDNQDSFSLSGRTISLVGFGNLGHTLLPLVRPFDGQVLVCDPWIHPAVLGEARVPRTPLAECFSRSSVVFLLAATRAENALKIDRSFLDLMPSEAIVVLVSCASIGNFHDLLDAAASGRIPAAIDVWPQEPIPADHRTRATPNT